MNNPAEMCSKVRAEGFTLVELIVTIVISGLLGFLIFSLMGTSLTDSPKSLIIARQDAGLESIMELITADYLKYTNIDTASGNPEDVLNNIYLTDYNLVYTRADVKKDFLDPSTLEVTAGPTRVLRVTITGDLGKTLVALFSITRYNTDPPDPIFFH